QLDGEVRLDIPGDRGCGQGGVRAARQGQGDAAVHGGERHVPVAAVASHGHVHGPVHGRRCGIACGTHTHVAVDGGGMRVPGQARGIHTAVHGGCPQVHTAGDLHGPFDTHVV